MGDTSKPGGPRLMTALGQVPPDAVSQPDKREGVVEIQPHAYVCSGDFGGLPGSGGERLAVAPSVLKVKGADEVGQEDSKAKRPQAEGAWPGAWLTAIRPFGQGAHIARQGHESR